MTPGIKDCKDALAKSKEDLEKGLGDCKNFRDIAPQGYRDAHMHRQTKCIIPPHTTFGGQRHKNGN